MLIYMQIEISGGVCHHVSPGTVIYSDRRWGGRIPFRIGDEAGGRFPRRNQAFFFCEHGQRTDVSVCTKKESHGQKKGVTDESEEDIL